MNTFPEDEQEPSHEDLSEMSAAHSHECGSCGAPFPCVLEDCEEPFMCAECAITEGEE